MLLTLVKISARVNHSYPSLYLLLSSITGLGRGGIWELQTQLKLIFVRVTDILC